MPTTQPLSLVFSSEALVAVRRAAGLTRAEVARKAELDPSQLWRIEARGTTPREDTAIRLARALGVPVSTLYRAA